MSRFHLLQGAMAYLASVWWMALLILWAATGPADTVSAVFGPDVFGAAPFALEIPVLPPVQRWAVAAIVGLMLMGPRLLGLIAHLRDHRPALPHLPVFAASIMVEMVISMLVAPILMLHQVRAVIRTLAGIDGGWIPHQVGRPTLRTLHISTSRKPSWGDPPRTCRSGTADSLAPAGGSFVGPRHSVVDARSMRTGANPPALSIGEP